MAGNPYATDGEAKKIPRFATGLQMGVAWEVDEGHSIDLDASVVLFDSSHNLVEKVNYQKLQSNNESIRHHGDCLTGDDDGDDEVVDFYMSEIPENVEYIFAVITVYSAGQNFEHVNSCRVQWRLIPGKKKPNPCEACGCPECCVDVCGPVAECAQSMKDCLLTPCRMAGDCVKEMMPEDCNPCGDECGLPACPCKPNLKDMLKKLMPPMKTPSAGDHTGMAVCVLYRDGKDWYKKQIGEKLHGRKVSDKIGDRPSGWSRPSTMQGLNVPKPGMPDMPDMPGVDMPDVPTPNVDMPDGPDMPRLPGRRGRRGSSSDDDGGTQDCLMWEVQDMSKDIDNLAGPKGDLAENRY